MYIYSVKNNIGDMALQKQCPVYIHRHEFHLSGKHTVLG